MYNMCVRAHACVCVGVWMCGVYGLCVCVCVCGGGGGEWGRVGVYDAESGSNPRVTTRVHSNQKQGKG